MEGCYTVCDPASSSYSFHHPKLRYCCAVSLLTLTSHPHRRDGDLTSPSSASAPLHTFHFPSSFSATIHSTSGNGDRSPSIELDALDLSVGGQGLIGRKVQLVEFDDGGVGGEGERGRVVREGVLGWN